MSHVLDRIRSQMGFSRMSGFANGLDFPPYQPLARDDCGQRRRLGNDGCVCLPWILGSVLADKNLRINVAWSQRVA